MDNVLRVYCSQLIGPLLHIKATVVVDGDVFRLQIDVDSCDRRKITADILDERATALAMDARDGNDCFHGVRLEDGKGASDHAH